MVLARGESNKEIARHLDVAGTAPVKIHVQNILKKLNSPAVYKSRCNAVEHGLDK